MMRRVRRFVRRFWRQPPPRIQPNPPVIPPPSRVHVDHRPRYAYKPEELDATTHLPRSIYCPITNLPMCDPVTLLDGFSYERDAILHWFQYKKTSPSTGKLLEHTYLIPNHALRNTIYDLIHEG